MMTETEALITLARRYCIDNFDYWATRYSKERTGSDNPYTYTESDYDLFPRYNVLRAILQNVELLVESSISPEECRLRLKESGKNAETPFTREPQNDTSRASILDERNKFIAFIDTISQKDIEGAVLLPYKKRLTEKVAEGIVEKLNKKYGYDGSWVPMRKDYPTKAVWIDGTDLTPADAEKLISAINRKADKRLFEIKEDGVHYELEVESLNLNCYETTYCDSTLGWILYGSHEATLAFGGDWLIAEVEQLFFSKKEKLNYYGGV